MADGIDKFKAMQKQFEADQRKNDKLQGLTAAAEKQAAALKAAAKAAKKELGDEEE